MSTLPSQLSLFSSFADNQNKKSLISLLSEDLDFHNEESGYASHNFHSFPAKFPPQLPRKFILNLTKPGDIVLDPMQGSGTSVLEAILTGRKAIGIDIDPLAVQISTVKTTILNKSEIKSTCDSIVLNAAESVNKQNGKLVEELGRRWDKKTKHFIDYWFLPETQIELLAILLEINRIQAEDLRRFFELAFSAIIITKSGGVSLARDLGHTRPHRAKIIIREDGEIIEGRKILKIGNSRKKYITKVIRSPILEFQKRVLANLDGLPLETKVQYAPFILFGNSNDLPIVDNSVDLVVTSPPYASNAIDYMRAHKFSLVWFGHQIDDLSEARGKYIGGEATTNFKYEEMPAFTTMIISEISELDSKKGQVLHRYYSEMKRSIQEMYRVLKPGKSAIVVVGSSTMRNVDTQTGDCLVEIGRNIGFQVPKIGVRNLDRDRRMMPAGAKIDIGSQIQRRMHEEYVIGFYKPHQI